MEERTLQQWCDDWNVLHIKYIKIGVNYRNEKMADYCEQIILKAKDSYYNTGQRIMDDHTFDRHEAWLKLLRPDSRILLKVGSSLRSQG